MLSKPDCRLLIFLILSTLFLTGCRNERSQITLPSTPTISEIPSLLPANTLIPAITDRPSLAFNISDFAFPASIDPAQPYLFYLHGKIIEDQGIPAVSPDYGEYEYGAILEKLRGYGFVVISEPRPMNTDSLEYAKKIAEQVTNLLEAGVPAKYITVVGASKGAGITIFVSHLLGNKDINFVILAICDPTTVADLIQNQITLVGNVLSIYDSADILAGSCQDLFSYSEAKGLTQHDEVVLNVGTGHGILYKPLDDWTLPTLQWARKP